MLILTLRTDKPEAEIGLYQDERQLQYSTWPAHRQLAETIHYKISELLVAQGRTWQDLHGIVVYKGPGSFTGLRIGLSTANGLAAGLRVPIVACADPGWLEHGMRRLLQGESERIAVPDYGAPPRTTAPKK